MTSTQPPVDLLALAQEQCSRAYAPYSRYPVGAALMASSGQLYGGSNVENASYGLTICAERSALVSAVSAGERQFRALVVATRDGAAPCGACLQALAEFCIDLPIWLVDASAAAPQATSLRQLLPQGFRSASHSSPG